MRMTRGFVRHAADWMKQFCHAKGASTAIIFALTAVPLLSAAGASLDLARGMMVKSRMASALDAAGLAVGTTNETDQNKLNALANQYFNANYPTTELGKHGLVQVTRPKDDAQHLTLEVDGSMPTSLLQVMGIGSLDFHLTNEVTRAATKLRVALVLDNTGSMSQTDNTGTSKMSALKTATHNLLTQLQNASANPGDVQVSIIPFSLDVNMGTGSVAADWIDWTDFESAPPNPPVASTFKKYGPHGSKTSCPFATNTSPYGYGCKTGPSDSASSTTTIPSSGLICPGKDSGNYNTGRGGHFYEGCYDSVPTVKGCTSNCTYNHTWQMNAHSAWTGCFMDRAQNYDTNNSAPVPGNKPTLFPAENNSSCPPVALMGFSPTWTSATWTSLNSLVDKMTPNGSTNQTIGLAWGWQSLAPTNPLNGPAQDPTIQNVIVLLSDGLNTQDRWYGDGSNQSTSVDNRMAQACANAKAANVKIYTVLVMSGNSSVLQSCATDPQKYFALSTAGQIVTAFNTIGTELANLHLSK